MLISICSCKKELPSNIKAAIFNCELQYNLNSDIDSIILNLDKAKISLLSQDSLSSLIFKILMNRVGKPINAMQSFLDEATSIANSFAN